ncbi:flagellar hook-length control protein FliK [Mesorhizobium sp. SP-1A]|uniref:flagellar hook-length control protein FliK n=1 Tax=Mesorhizobium sp. SP-1A TaxID=3077840 RepID=UPI0028F6F463|nr:flagellar hook-length control protein FliK [Mesorhizobium sp. SP-1A]
MTAAIGQNVPVGGQAKNSPRHSAGRHDEKDTAFTDLLLNGPPRKSGQPSPKQVAHAARMDPPQSGKTRDQDVQEEASPSDDDENGTAPLPDRLPLWTVVRGLHPNSEGHDEDAKPGKQPGAPEADAPAQAGHPAQTVIGHHFHQMAGPRPVTTGAMPGQPARSTDVAGPMPTVSAADPDATSGTGPELPDMPDIELSVPQKEGTAHETQRPLAGPRAAALQNTTVIAEQSFPAPAAVPLGQAASQIANRIASDSGWRQTAAASAPSLHGTAANAAPAHTLKIELHPAELGTVTANLRMAGEQLTIEIRPETHEAYRKLTSDSETIVKSLRALGFEIDKVAVLQPSLATAPAARADGTGSQAMQAGRDQAFSQPGTGGGQGGHQPERNRNDDGQDHGRTAPQLRERADGGLFI